MSLCSNECASFCKRQLDARGCAGAHASNIVFLTSLVGRVAELDIAVFARTCSPFGAPPPSTTFRCYSASSSPCAKPRNAITFKPFGVLGLLDRSEEHTSELQSHLNLVCRLLLEKKKKKTNKMRIVAYE